MFSAFSACSCSNRLARKTSFRSLVVWDRRVIHRPVGFRKTAKTVKNGPKTDRPRRLEPQIARVRIERPSCIQAAGHYQEPKFWRESRTPFKRRTVTMADMKLQFGISTVLLFIAKWTGRVDEMNQRNVA
jgi:hypothetical protein